MREPLWTCSNNVGGLTIWAYPEAILRERLWNLANNVGGLNIASGFVVRFLVLSIGLPRLVRLPRHDCHCLRQRQHLRP